MTDRIYWLSRHSHSKPGSAVIPRRFIEYWDNLGLRCEANTQTRVSWQELIPGYLNTFKKAEQLELLKHSVYFLVYFITLPCILYSTKCL